ncbi:helix-turn-helix domain-containing protein [Enterococcus faecalis]|uniref:helix-turn-helix domain-containing protein n=1 Tax=Enterococcus faecalis TaxID=1351 RepID=UPI001787628D|nr:helix-turn-helix domain-containing protein [Enterococcus faecalis]MBD9891337.1 helix-turn-helix domain-containing protein [Enterococcus faecalis]
MLENYIERNIERKVGIITRIYNNPYESLESLSNCFSVSVITIRRDIDSIIEEFNEYILFDSRYEHGFSFSKENTLATLKQMVYKGSDFLKILSFMVESDRSLFDIAIDLDISIAKSYQLKDKISKFLATTNLKIEKNKITGPEHELRLLMLQIAFKLDHSFYETKLDNNTIENIIHSLERISDVQFTYNSKKYLSYALIICMERKYKSDEELDKYSQYLDKSKWRDYLLILQEESKIDFLNSLYNFRFFIAVLTITNYLTKDPYIRRNYIKSILNEPIVIELIQNLEMILKCNLINNEAFLSSLNRVISSLQLTVPTLIPAKPIVLDDSLYHLKNEVYLLFNRWILQYFGKSIVINTFILDTFILELSFLVNIRPKRIILVTERDTNYFLISEVIERTLRNVEVMPKYFNNLEEAIEVSKGDYILCESYLYDEKFHLKKTKCGDQIIIPFDIHLGIGENIIDLISE